VCDEWCGQLSRSELASKILVLHGLERKASVLMSGEHSVLPAHMDIDELKEELRSRRIGTHGEREVLERRLEEAWIKEGSRFDMQGEDGYAFGRHAVSAKNLVEEMTEEQVKDELAKPQWGLKKKDIPKKHHERMLMLESLYSDELQRRKEVAFNIALNDMLASYQLKCSGPKAQLFQRLTQHLKSIAEARGGESRCVCVLAQMPAVVRASRLAGVCLVRLLCWCSWKKVQMLRCCCCCCGPCGKVVEYTALKSRLLTILHYVASAVAGAATVQNTPGQKN
jgi:hypothetical protein